MKKKIALFLLCFVFLGGIFAQVPNTFQYQAVVRNDDGTLLANMPVEVKIKIFKGAPDGTAVYEETHTASTNAGGVVNVRVGSGVNRSRSFLFADIDWSGDTYFIETQLDRGTGYVSAGTQQLLSVPYAKYARVADNVHVKSPDGKRWRIRVDNDGSISAQAVTE